MEREFQIEQLTPGGNVRTCFIVRAVFARCSAALLDSDRDDERHHRARVLAELFDLHKERAAISAPM